MNDEDEKLLRKIERDLRYTPGCDFSACPVLDAYQWELDRLLRLNIESDWFLFVGTGLSAFFNPELYYKISDLDVDVILKSSALFSVATPPPRCELRLVVIERGNHPLEKFLTKHGVQWLHYSDLIPAAEFAMQVDQALSKSQSKEHIQRRPINYAEFRVQHVLRDVTRYELESGSTLKLFLEHGHSHDEAHTYLANSSYRLLHEVALHRLKPKFALQLSPSAQWILETSSVDVLLHSRGKNSRPLVAVEVDGPHHLEQKQIAKDSAKGEILKALGIPIFRITPKDAAFWTYSNELPSTDKERLNGFSKLISDVVLTVATCVSIFGKLQAEIDLAKAACVQMEDAIAKSSYDISYLDLTDEQRAVVDQEMFLSPTFNDWHLAEQLYQHELEKAIERATEQTNWPDDIASFVSAATIYGDCATGMSASIVLDIPGVKPIELFSPSIRGAVEGVEPELIDAKLDECLVYFLAEEAGRQIRMLTPAQKRRT